jgi:hypothetical protein
VTLNKDTNKIENRVFLVGCPRSGTTFLQILLARHPNIASFPESHFFPTLHPKHEPRRRLLKLASRKTKQRLIKFLLSSKHPSPERVIYPWTLFQFQYINRFIKALDLIAITQGKKNWLEKTPDHIYYVNEIERSVKNARFIHIIRGGPDVVASLYEVTHKYPRYWGGCWSVNQCIDKWASCIQESRSHALKQNHLTVQYEDLVAEPENIATKIFSWLCIKSVNHILLDNESLGGLIEKYESWKFDVSLGIDYTPQNKFKTVFSTEQQRDILRKLGSLGI